MNAWMDLTNDWLFRTTVEGTILITTVLGLSWTLGRHLGPRWRVALWALVGLKLIVPAFVPSTPGIGNWLSRPNLAEEMLVSPSEIEGDSTLSEAQVAVAPAPPVPIESSWDLSLGGVLFVVWILGVIAFVGGLIWRHRRFAERAGLTPCHDTRALHLVREVRKELGVKSDFRVLLGPAGTTPAVCGVMGGSLILPCDWETRFESGVTRYIVMHELEHIRHRDVLLNWIAAAVNALHWFNPLVWLAVSRFQSDRELRCDANTISRLGPSERFDYGRTLLRVQSDFLPAPAMAGVAPCVRNHPTLHQRILMITNPTRRKSWLNALLALGVSALIPLSFGSATADEERPAREGDRPKEGEREGGGARDGDRPKGGERDGERPRGGERDGERDGERPKEGERPRGGEREGGPREGGPREGGPREGGPREGGPREGGPREGGHHPVEIGIFVVPDGVRLGDRFVENAKLRGEFSRLEAHSAIVNAEPQVPFHQINQVVDALRDSGIRDVRIGGKPREGGHGPREGEGPRPEGGMRDGDRPRPEGARDGDRPRPEGARDGDKPRPEGARDGDKPRPEGARDGDKPRPEGARDGDRPRPEGGPRDGDKPRPEGEKEGDA